MGDPSVNSLLGQTHLQMDIISYTNPSVTSCSVLSVDFVEYKVVRWTEYGHALAIFMNNTRRQMCHVRQPPIYSGTKAPVPFWKAFSKHKFCSRLGTQDHFPVHIGLVKMEATHLRYGYITGDIEQWVSGVGSIIKWCALVYFSYILNVLDLFNLLDDLPHSLFWI